MQVTKLQRLFLASPHVRRRDGDVLLAEKKFEKQLCYRGWGEWVAPVLKRVGLSLV